MNNLIENVIFTIPQINVSDLDIVIIFIVTLFCIFLFNILKLIFVEDPILKNANGVRTGNVISYWKNNVAHRAKVKSIKVSYIFSPFLIHNKSCKVEFLIKDEEKNEEKWIEIKDFDRIL